ncbi:MAG: RNA polymerase sigma factor [Planctomycetota bacterium]
MTADAENPLCGGSPGDWDRLIETVGPASLLAVIEHRMSPALRQRYAAEDVLQEALLYAWRDRARHEWRGIRSFRNWLLTIIDHRICDLADQAQAEKRGGNVRFVHFSALSGAGGANPSLLPWSSTTPSRIAVYREQAAAMRAALASLPDDLRDVLRLRLFEQLPVEETARRLNLGLSAVRHRFRRGAELYQRSLVAELGTRSLSISHLVLRGVLADSSPEE